ncbi:hypothetical protein [Vibrio cyclitrophicus]|uniref:hypothetical protein n=1 Tax=Vibrio cyclitrophicus TaxID=47951 RepID=UPI000694203A|nr:hypothetical protein [Vibrio cyclitrophicus]
MEHVTNPIHLPCPDMAGCVNPDPKLTQNSLAMVAKLRAELKGRLKKKAKPFIPARLGGVSHENFKFERFQTFGSGC